MTVEQRRQQDDFVASIITKAREGNTDNFLVGRTYDDLSGNSNWTSIKVDFDYYSTVPSLMTCKMLQTARDNLLGRPAGQKVLVGYFGNFYVIIDVILE